MPMQLLVGPRRPREENDRGGHACARLPALGLRENPHMPIRTEGHVTIDRPAAEVFDTRAGEHLPEYIDDFEVVSHEQEGAPAQGHCTATR